MPLVDRFVAGLGALALEPGAAVVAVSGGPDSVALLDLLSSSQSAHRLRLIVAHADHGIHPASAEVAAAVKRLAALHRMPFELGRLALGPGTTETAARAARYAWLEDVCARHGAATLFTAHHADDQAETVLMRLMHGSGPAGLAAMAVRRGRLVRPLLPFRREELARYVHERGLACWSDPANTDPAHLRSWLRTSVMPGLTARLPDVVEHLNRTARLAARDRMAWDGVLAEIPGLDCVADPEGISIAATPLLGYDSAVAEGVIRAAARRSGCRIGERRMAAVLDLLARGTSGRETPLGDGWRAELSVGRLRVYRRAVTPAARALTDAAGEAQWGGWSIRWRAEPAPAAHERRSMTAWFPPVVLGVRDARPGDALRPLGGRGTRALVRCFQEARVPRSRRGAWPVFVADGGAVWVPGVCRADALIPAEGSEALRVDVTYP